MPSEKKIEAYRKRLAKISAKDFPGNHLTRECMYAVVTYYDQATESELQGTLTGFAYSITEGLFGPRTTLTINVCGACVHKPGNSMCASSESTVENAHVTKIERNEEQPA